jgi:hypothetical protein
MNAGTPLTHHAIAQGKVDGVVHDATILRYETRQELRLRYLGQ